MGVGYMSDGSSEETLSASGFWHNQLRKIQEMLKENMDILCETNRQVIIQLNMKEVEKVNGEKPISQKMFKAI